MGFGHRVYKNYDPRAKIIKKACFDVLERLGVHSKLLEIAVELEEITLKDEYFVERQALPERRLLLGRLPGWIAQWMELHRDPAFKIGRPRQVYTGATKTAYVPVEDR